MRSIGEIGESSSTILFHAEVFIEDLGRNDQPQPSAIIVPLQDDKPPSDSPQPKIYEELKAFFITWKFLQ